MENLEIPGRIQRERFTLVDFFRKKSNTFRGITFFPLSPKRPKFSVPFVGITSARRQVERKRKIYRYFVNGTIQARSCFRFQKKYQYLQMVNAICLKMGHAFFLIGLVPGLCVCSPGGTGVGPRPDRAPLGVEFKISDEHPRPSLYGSPPPPPGGCLLLMKKEKEETTVNSLVSDHPWCTEKWSLMGKRSKIK